MKIIALLPFKNEASFLHIYLSSVSKIADQIIAIDDNSTDESCELIKKAGGLVYKNTEIVNSGWAEYSIRQNLLRLGREKGGTHFICLDADEAFIQPFTTKAHSYIQKLNPGQKLVFPWLALWKSAKAYRSDASVWSNNFKDFIFCDSPELNHDYAFLGVGRTPGENSSKNIIKLNLPEAAVLHFQFVPWQAFQIKQAWYRCSELIQNPQSARAINKTYSITLDDPSAKLTSIPEEWLSEITVPDNLESLDLGWRFKEIINWFDIYAIKTFEPLQIWHIPELYEQFIQREGREPQPITDPFAIKLQSTIAKKIPQKFKNFLNKRS